MPDLCFEPAFLLICFAKGLLKPAFPILISNNHANFIFLGFSNAMKDTMYHLLTVNVRNGTEINIPNINFRRRIAKIPLLCNPVLSFCFA
jgi:hypothetical protein